jgi:hypothetical protein
MKRPSPDPPNICQCAVKDLGEVVASLAIVNVRSGRGLRKSSE